MLISCQSDKSADNEQK